MCRRMCVLSLTKRWDADTRQEEGVMENEVLLFTPVHGVRVREVVSKNLSINAAQCHKAQRTSVRQ